MSARDRLIHEIKDAPESLVNEILGFVESLKARHLRDAIETAAASEPALSKDWLLPEEDEAWKNL